MDDVRTILKKINIPFPEDSFNSICMQIWFKYLRESEIAFQRNEHLSSNDSIAVHPHASARDKFCAKLLAKPNSDFDNDEESDKLPLPINQADNPTSKKVIKLSGSYKAVKSDQTPSKGKYSDFPEMKDPRNFLKYKQLSVCKTFPLFPNAKLYDAQTDQFDEFCGLIESLKHTPSQKDLASLSKKKIETGEVEEDDNFIDKEKYSQYLHSQMSSKLKTLIPEDGGVEAFFTRTNKGHSIRYVDIMSRNKLLSIIAIALRLLNIPIFLSDLIRWAVDGNIRFSDSLQCLPRDWELLFVDKIRFCDSKVPAHNNLMQIVKQIAVHTKLDSSMFPRANLWPLVARYIKDLNLPQGLILVVKKRYSKFIEFYHNKSEHPKAPNFVDHLDLVAYMSIVLTLRDLFDLTGPNEAQYIRFKDTPLGLCGQLFLWHDWIRFSKLRLNILKIYNLCPTGFAKQAAPSNLVGLDSVMAMNARMNDVYGSNRFYKWFDHQKSKRYAQKAQLRPKMQAEYEDLFLPSTAQAWKQSIITKSQNVPAPSIFPLTSNMESIIGQISNKRISQILSVDYRSKLVTPYTCEHGAFHHRRACNFNSNTDLVHSNFTFVDKNFQTSLSPFGSFQHLIELGEVITSAQLSKYYNTLIRKADKMSNDK